MKTNLTIFFFFLFNLVYSQKEGNNWYFGNKAALDFNSGVPIALINSSMNATEGCSTISDTYGNLLFYSNGQTIWNRNHNIMLNGNGLAGYPRGTQSGLIAPQPGSFHTYYVFTVLGGGPNNGLCYSIIDMNLDGGLGAVTIKNILLLDSTTNKITAIRHSNNSAIWIITHEWKTNAFFAYLLSSSGLNTTPVISYCGRNHGPSNLLIGYMKASPDGRELAVAVTGAFTQLFYFNPTNGVVSKPVNLKYLSKDIIGAYGVEFSPNGKLLYVSNSKNNGDSSWIFQFNVQNPDSNTINNSCNVIALSSNANRHFLALQIAPDKKIYIADVNSLYLHTINSPNSYGISCGYIFNAIFLNGKSSMWGLPNFLQSYYFLPDFTAKPLCFGDSTYFSIPDTSQLDSVFWNFGNSASGIQNTSKLFNPAHKYNDTGNYKVVLLSFHNAMPDTTYRDIRITYPPHATFTLNDSLQCLKGNYFTFTNNSTIQSGSMTWEWDFGDSSFVYSRDTSHTYLNDSTYKVKLVALSDYGCVDIFSRNVYVTKNPIALTDVNDSIQCLSGNSFSFTNKSTNANSYQWDFGDGKSDTNQNSVHSYNLAGNYITKLIAKSTADCSDSAIYNISVFDNPVAAFTVNDSLQCIKANLFTFTNNSTIKTGSMTWEWDFGDSSFVYSKDTSHTYTRDSNYNVRLVTLSDYGCADTFSRNVYIAKNPVALTDINDSIECLSGNSFTFTNKSTDASNYKWDFGDGNSDTSKNSVHSFISAGNYITKLIAKSNAGCSDSAQLKISVIDNPVSAFSVNDTSQLLSANNFIFSNLTNCKPASSNCKYLWDFGDSQSDTLSNPTHSYAKIGKYNVLLTSNSTNGCKDTVSLLVKVFNIIVNTAFSVKDVCLGDYAFFKNSSTIQYDSFQKFLWDFGDGSTISQQNPQHLYADTGTYKIQLISVSYGGYKDTTYGKVIVYPSPTVEIIATPDSILEQGIKATLSANGSFDSLLWSTGAITANIEVEKAGIYSLRVVDANGCDATDQITIEYLPEKPFGAMNVITTNGDGINDVWKVWNIEKYQPCKLAIYNRWGDELYSTNDYKNNWDGKYKGKSLPEGTYYFVLITRDGRVYTGAINILRN